MKDKLQARYNAWDQDVGAVIKEAGAQVDNMVAAQEYAKPAEIRKVFKALDARRTKTESQITKIPVTTPEACQFLHDKMDETQASLTNLLRSALITAPQQETQGVQSEAPAETVE
jgi:hypothetical protein